MPAKDPRTDLPSAERSSPTSTSLLERAKARDPEAWRKLVQLYGPFVYGWCRRWGIEPGDSADVVQEVFLAVLTKLGEFRGECRFSTWLTAITVNKCRHVRRQRLLRLAFLRRAKSGAVAAAAGPGVSEELGPEALDRVRRAIRALPARHREVVVLRYLEEMPVAEVSRALGISAHAADMRLHRARGRLREALSDLVEE
jgi:RNA polymerase sigma-70 factor (ECF subfamily)